jgi:hypothetical protein
MTEDKRESALAERCLSRTAAILGTFRYRVAGTDECRGAAREIAASLRAHCDAVEIEPFRLHPRVLWWVGKAIAIAYVFGSLLGLLGGYGYLVGSILTLTALFYAVMHYVIYAQIGRAHV